MFFRILLRLKPKPRSVVRPIVLFAVTRRVSPVAVPQGGSVGGRRVRKPQYAETVRRNRTPKPYADRYTPAYRDRTDHGVGPIDEQRMRRWRFEAYIGPAAAMGWPPGLWWCPCRRSCRSWPGRPHHGAHRSWGRVGPNPPGTYRCRRRSERPGRSISAGIGTTDFTAAIAFSRITVLSVPRVVVSVRAMLRVLPRRPRHR